MQSAHFFVRDDKVGDNGAVCVCAQDELTHAHAAGCRTQADKNRGYTSDIGRNDVIAQNLVANERVKRDEWIA
jgi:hypothetical protein